jgi:hypothetical protein
MKDTIIRLNEDTFRRLVSESVKGVLNEIGYRGAALTHAANYNAKIDYRQNSNVNARSKMAKSETITLDAISLAIRDNFPNLVLEFVEENNATNRAYPVDLYFAQVKYIDKDRCVLLGKLDVAEKPFGVGTIEYNFNTQEFYRVSYSDKTTRSRRLHSLIVHNKEVVNELLTFISDYLYSTEDYENDVNANGPTPSKRH